MQPLLQEIVHSLNYADAAPLDEYKGYWIQNPAQVFDQAICFP